MSRDFRKKMSLPLVFAGGVMSNTIIRSKIEAELSDVYFAEPALSADNAVGIAALTADAYAENYR